MPINQELIAKFTKIKKIRDDRKAEYIRLQTQVETARDRYAKIMEDLRKLDIGSLEELRTKSIELTNSINTKLDEAMAIINKLEEADRETDRKETGIAK